MGGHAIVARVVGVAVGVADVIDALNQPVEVVVSVARDKSLVGALPRSTVSLPSW